MSIFNSHKIKSIIQKSSIIFVGFVSVLLFELLPLSASAATTSPTPAPRISFTFDDSLQSTYTNAEPILTQNGLTGTDYVITNCVGMTAVPNTCRANTDTPYMTWAQIQSLQNTKGWEIGSHTVDHQCLASNSSQDPGDCQKTTLTTAQVDAELANSKSTLAANEVNATDFAPPYGDFNNATLAEIAKYYASMRQFKNASNNPNVWPYSDYYLQDKTVLEGTDTVASVESAINSAITNNQWLILTFHNILPSPSNNPDDYEYSTSELSQIAAYVKAQKDAGKIQNVNVNQGLVTSSANLLPNSSFATGISGGWTTDNPTAITADSANNGSFPNPATSVKLTTGSTSTTAHLFSPKIAVTSGTQYVLKNFLNLQKITSGQIGFYIDEYNANGQWISGQWKTGESNPFVEDMNFTYTPSSPSVSTASLQVIDSGAGITAYFANPQWFPISTPTVTNLMPNSTFDAGIAGGWTTDDAADIKADANNNGSPADPVNSVSLVSRTTSANSHLFSPQIAVTPTKTYSVSSWLILKKLTNTTSGEVGFYIDEYNASGQWISGQYKTGYHTLGATTVGFAYKPTSTNVSKARLQIIDVGAAGIQAYVDDVVWSAN